MDEFEQLLLLSNPNELPPPSLASSQLNRKEVVLASHESLIERERKRSWSDGGCYKQVIGPFKSFSKYKALNVLEAVDAGLGDLWCDSSAKGRFLVVRIISRQAVRTVAVHLVVEDTQGQVAPLQLYRLTLGSTTNQQQDLDDQFKFGDVFAIKEPTLRSNRLGFLIRVDSPFDLIRLYPTSPFYSFPRTSSNNSGSKHDHHFLKEADDHEKATRFYAALNSYTQGIESLLERKKVKGSIQDLETSLYRLYSKRSSVHHQMKRYTSATKDATIALDFVQEILSSPSSFDHCREIVVDSIKLLVLQRSMSYYGNQEWDMARSDLDRLENLLDILLAESRIRNDDQDFREKVQELRKKVEDRLKENHSGLYDWRSLFSRSVQIRQSHTLEEGGSSLKGERIVALELAEKISDYRHPSIVSNHVPNKGVGLITMDIIERGELILLEEPLAFAPNPNPDLKLKLNPTSKSSHGSAITAIERDDLSTNSRVIGVNLYTKTYDPSSFNEMINVLIDKMREDERVWKIVLELSEGPAATAVKDFSTVEEAGEGLDVSRVEAIATFNSFNVRSINRDFEDQHRTHSRGSLSEEAAAAGREFESEMKSEGSAIFNWASRFNHSCLPNLEYSFITIPSYSYPAVESTPYILLRANRRIEQGEELTIGYFDSTRFYQERARRFEEHGFICTCDLCEMDRDQVKRIGQEGVEELERLVGRMDELGRKFIEGQDEATMFDFVEEMKRTIVQLETISFATTSSSSLNQLRPTLARPYTILAESLTQVERPLESIHYFKSALKTLGTRFDQQPHSAAAAENIIKFPLVGDSSNHVKIALKIANHYSLLYSRSKGKKKEEYEKAVTTWIENAKKMEEVESGLEVFDLRYGTWLEEMGMDLKTLS